MCLCDNVIEREQGIRVGILTLGGAGLYFQYADLNRHVDALNAWRNATVLKPEHSLAWNNMIILLDNTGTEEKEMMRRCSTIHHSVG